MARALPFLLAAALAGASGCGATPTSPSSIPLRLTVVQNPTFTADSLSFTMRLDNISQAAVDLTFPSSCDVLPIFTAANGRDVTPVGGGAGCATVITRRQLQPGESLFRSLIVKAGNAFDPATVILPPGSYQLRARLADFDFRLQSEPVALTLQ